MIKSIVTSKIVDHCVTKYIIPKLDSLAKSCKDLYKDYMIPRREHFEEYLYRSYEKYIILNTLVLRNQQKNIKDLYIPLTIEKTGNNHSTAEKLDKYPVKLVNEYNKILITDTAGMGKSTLTKFLFLDVIENGHGIPIYIELRRLSKDRTILQEIHNQLNSLTNEFDSDLLLRFIQTGDFIFFLDGYDEIPFSEIKYVTSNIQDFISKANKNTFFLTSRPESSLSCFGDFQEFSIKELSTYEAYELINKYDKIGETSNALIRELQTGRYEGINDFLKNPLLVSLLFTAFDYKHTIPLKKHIFYRQVYDAYFETHDLSKGEGYAHDKYSNLDIDDFDKVLRYVAFNCLNKGKIEFVKDELLNILDNVKTLYPDLKFSSSDFVKDITVTVPLFCIDGNYYRWVHKSLQEYFAAQFIYKDAKEKQDAILMSLYNSDNLAVYINLLDIYCDIDSLGFRKNILLPFCREYIEFYEKNYFESNIINKVEIECRLSILFFHRIHMICDNKHIMTFTLLGDMIKPYEENICRVLHKLDSNIWMAYTTNIKSYLFILLLKKYRIIFEEYESHTIQSCESLLSDTIIRIDVNTGNNSREDYMFFNQFLVDYSNIVSSFYLNYNACKDMEKEILQQQNNINLLEGL